MRTTALLAASAALNLAIGGWNSETPKSAAESESRPAQTANPRRAIKLKVGDVVAVTSPYGGEFRIMADGAIYGRGFGRLELEGMTWDDAQAAMRRALRPFVRESEVLLSIRDLRRDVVYLIGMGGGRGPVDLSPNLSLKQLMASAPLDGNADQTLVQLFRGGVKRAEYNAAKLAAGDPEAPDQILQPDDVVTLAPTPFVRIWVTGLAMKTGQLKVPAGTDVYKALAEAGGVKWPELAADPSWQQYGRIVVHRGPNASELPLMENGHSIVLEAGDTIAVLAPEEVRVTVAGEVQKPGEVILRGDRTLTAGLAHAGGPSGEGSFAAVQVFRKGELFQVDASRAPEAKDAFRLEPGDLVYVGRNERNFSVLGEVAKPGKIAMKDGRAYRLSDALAEAGGLSGRGTLRRVYLCRADAKGKVAAAAFNLDEFLKDGRMESNPELRPGDIVLFGQPKGFTLGTATQVVSGALLIDALGGGRP